MQCLFFLGRRKGHPATGFKNSSPSCRRIDDSIRFYHSSPSKQLGEASDETVVHLFIPFKFGQKVSVSFPDMLLEGFYQEPGKFQVFGVKGCISRLYFPSGNAGYKKVRCEQKSHLLGFQD